MQSSETIRQELTSAMDEFQSIPQHTRSFWGSTTCLRNLVDERTAAFVVSIGNLNADPLHLGGSLGFVYNEARHQTELASLKILSDHLVQSAEYIEADERVRPAVDKIHALEDALRDALNAEARVEQDRLDRLEAAKAEAIKSLEIQFAKEAPPAPPEPKPLVRGRNIAKRDTEAEAVTEEMDLAEPSFT